MLSLYLFLSELFGMIAEYSLCHTVVIDLWPPWNCNNSLINCTIFQIKRESIDMTCLFWFSVQLLTETCFISVRIQQDLTVNILRWSCKMPDFFFILIKLKVSQHILAKVSKIQFHQNPFGWSRAVAACRLVNWHTDITKLIGFFTTWQKAPKMADWQSMLTSFLHITFVNILTHTKMPNLCILYDDRECQGITKEWFFSPPYWHRFQLQSRMASCTAYTIWICLFCSITKWQLTFWNKHFITCDQQFTLRSNKNIYNNQPY